VLKAGNIRVYTDGSCHSQLLIGAWAAILFIDGAKVILKGDETNTTHNRMELLAVIRAIHFIDNKNLGADKIEVYSDSQYVVNLITRKEKLKRKNFITNKGTAIQNIDLVQILISQIESHTIDFIKVKAHQKNGDEINREVDLLVRKLVRNNVLSHEQPYF
jgi:ribonuclease HI